MSQEDWCPVCSTSPGGQADYNRIEVERLLPTSYAIHSSVPEFAGAGSGDPGDESQHKRREQADQHGTKRVGSEKNEAEPQQGQTITRIAVEIHARCQEAKQENEQNEEDHAVRVEWPAPKNDRSGYH